MKRASLACFGAILALACGSKAPPAAPVAPVAESVEPGVPDRSALPTPGPRPDWAPPKPESWALSNGSGVLFLRDTTVPLVSIVMVVPRGAETDPPEKAGLTQLMADMLDEGAGSRSALELSDELKKLATDYSASARTDALVLSMDLIADNLEASVALLADIVRRPTFDRGEFNRRKGQLVAQALANESEPRSARRVAMYRSQFGKGYAGIVPDGTRKTLEAITYDDVVGHYRRLVASEGVQFAVSGGVERERLAKALDTAFGDWTSKAQAEARPLAPEPTAPAVYMVDFPGAAQSVLGVLRRAPGDDTPDYFPATIFNRGFGEAFTSRVNMNLREDKGYTYGAVAAFVRFELAGIYGIFADVRTDTTRASIDEVFGELSAVCGARPLTVVERDDAVNGLLLGYPARFESTGLVAQALTEIIVDERPLDWFQRWPEQIEAVTLEAANATARKYCDPKGFSIVIAGDRAKVAPTLDGLGLPLVVLDAQGEPLKGQ